MTFSEFLLAQGESGLVESLRESSEFEPFPEYLFEPLGTKLLHYQTVGGMPEAVNDWVETGSLAEARKTQLRILADYKDDFGKHAAIELLPKIRLVWQSVPAQLAKENEKFCYD